MHAVGGDVDVNDEVPDVASCSLCTSGIFINDKTNKR